MDALTPYANALKKNNAGPMTRQEADAKAKAAVQTGQTVPRTLEEYKAAQGVNRYASGGSAGSYSQAPQQANARNIYAASGALPSNAATAVKTAAEPAPYAAALSSQSSSPSAAQQSTDYSLLIRDAMAAGADADTVQRLLDARVAKATADPALNKYAFDDTWKLATDYISSLRGGDAGDRETELKGNYGDVEDLVSELKGIYGGGNDLYSQALAAQKAANDAAVRQAADRLRAQKADADSSYADLFRQLYLNKMRSGKNIDQLLAARGITGGAAESTALSLDAGYEEALRQGARDRIDTLSELDRAISETELTGDISNAEAAASNAMSRADSYADVLRSLISRYDTLAENERARESDSSSRARNYAYQTAMAMLQSGILPSSGLLADAGLSDNDALSMVESVRTETDTARADTDAATARNIVMTMLQSGVMPSDALLAAAGISRADAESIAGAVREETAYSRSSETASAALKTAMTMLQSGIMPSSALLADAGLSEQDARSIADAAAKQAQAAAYSAVASKPVTYTKAQAEAALAAALAGDRGSAVRQIVEGYYGLPLESVIAGSAPQTKYTQTQAETALYAALSGDRSGPVRQIVEGWYGLPLETVLSIYTGEVAGEEESGTDYGGAEITAPAAYTPTPPEESLDYDADSGIFRWNGGIYTDLKRLTDDMADARLSEATEKILERKFASLGWPHVRIK